MRFQGLGNVWVSNEIKCTHTTNTRRQAYARTYRVAFVCCVQFAMDSVCLFIKNKRRKCYFGLRAMK